MFMVELKRQREKVGLSQQRLADRLGVSQATVGMWESGKREPNFAMLCTLADFFSVSTDTLLGHRSASQVSISPPKFAISASDAELLKRFSLLDDMAKARILNSLEFECQSISQENVKSSGSPA